MAKTKPEYVLRLTFGEDDDERRHYDLPARRVEGGKWVMPTLSLDDDEAEAVAALNGGELWHEVFDTTYGEVDLVELIDTQTDGTVADFQPVHDVLRPNHGRFTVWGDPHWKRYALSYVEEYGSGTKYDPQVERELAELEASRKAKTKAK